MHMLCTGIQLYIEKYFFYIPQYIFLYFIDDISFKSLQKYITFTLKKIYINLTFVTLFSEDQISVLDKVAKL